MSVSETPTRSPIVSFIADPRHRRRLGLERIRHLPKKPIRVRVHRGMSAATDGLTYRECRPPAALRSVVECFWRRERWRPPDSDLGVLPDGRIDVIWAADGEVVVAGPQRRPLGRPLPPELVVVGVR